MRGGISQERLFGDLEMIILKILLALVGLGVIVVALISLFSGLTEEGGFFFGFLGALLVFFVFRRESVSAFFGVTLDLLDQIAFLSLIGGGILCVMDIGRIGSVVVTIGWIAIGLVLLQVVPIPFIANLVEIAAGPFIVACIPLLLIIYLFLA